MLEFQISDEHNANVKKIDIFEQFILFIFIIEFKQQNSKANVFYFNNTNYVKLGHTHKKPFVKQVFLE